jgi:carbamoyl-phosphate synthase large subunit
VRVLVTGVAGATIGEQVCKALRHGEAQYEIVACNLEPAAMKVVAAEHYEILPRAQDPAYWDTLQGIIRRYSVRFVVPGSDPELSALCTLRRAIEDEGAKLLANSANIVTTCMDKAATFDFLGDHHFQIPATYKLDNLDSLCGLADRFPWIIKPLKGGSGSSNVFLAQDRDELEIFIAYLRKYGYPIILQEYVGTVDDEYTVGVLHYPDGLLAGSIAIKRRILSGISNRLIIPNRTGRAELGELLAVSSGITQGELADFPEIRRQAEAIAEAFGSTGPLNIQGRWNGKTFLPFEINPRFSGTEPVRAMAGFNGPEAVINWYLNEGREQLALRAKRFGTFRRGLIDFFQAIADGTE